MTNLTAAATPGWDDVPELEKTTIALAGPGAPMNAQAQALLNRTENLKATTTALGSFTQTGTGAVARTLTSKLADIIDVRDFGAVGDGVTDDTTAITNAIAAATAANARLVLPVPPHSFRVTNTVNFRNLTVDGAGSTIYVDTVNIGVIIGGTATSYLNPDQNIGSVYRNTSLAQTNPSLRVIGAKDQRITVRYVDYMQIWADMTNTADGSSAYSTFNILYAARLDLTAGPTPGWINENTFHMNRCLQLNIFGTSTYWFDHNRFHGGTFENTSSISMDYANDNKFWAMRFELGPTTITFGANADRNTIIKTFAAGEYSGGPNAPLINGTITNNGGPGNCVLNEQQTLRESVVVAEADTSDIVLNNTDASMLPEYNRSPALQAVTGNSGNQHLCMSDYLAAHVNDYFSYCWEGANSGDSPLYRAAILFYDANYQPVTPLQTWVTATSVPYVVSNSLLSANGSATGVWMRLQQAAITAGVAFIRVAIDASNGQLPSALARRLYVTLFSLNATSNRADNAPSKSPRSRTYTVSAMPTKGYAPLGFSCVKNDFTARYHCTSSSETTLSAAAAAAATTITVTSATGFAAGDVVGINQDDRSTFWTTVSSVSGTTITLAAGVTTTSVVGSRVVRNHWKTETLTVA
jgi:hypothetical protein